MSKIYIGETVKEFTAKDGTVIPAGSELKVDWKGGTKPFVTIESAGIQDLRTKNKNVALLLGIHIPDMDELEEESNDGVCSSVLGESVEPDGYDQYGSPSWLLVYGVI